MTVPMIPFIPDDGDPIPDPDYEDLFDDEEIEYDYDEHPRNHSPEDDYDENDDEDYFIFGYDGGW